MRAANPPTLPAGRVRELVDDECEEGQPRKEYSVTCEAMKEAARSARRFSHFQVSGPAYRRCGHRTQSGDDADRKGEGESLRSPSSSAPPARGSGAMLVGATRRPGSAEGGNSAVGFLELLLPGFSRGSHR